MKLIKYSIINLILIINMYNVCLSVTLSFQNRIDNLIQEIDNKEIVTDLFTFRQPKESLVFFSDALYKIKNPKEAFELSQIGQCAIPSLIKLFNDKNRDWAAHVIIASITSKDNEITSSIEIYNKPTDEKIINWRKTEKQKALKYWKEWYKKNQHISIFFDKDLEKIPDHIWELKNIKKLILSYNYINKISPKIKNLKELEIIELDHNELTELPIEFNNLKNLKKLDLSSNRLKSIINVISNLKGLEELDIYDNPISDEEKEKLKKLFPNCKIWT